MTGLLACGAMPSDTELLLFFLAAGGAVVFAITMVGAAIVWAASTCKKIMGGRDL